SSGRFRLEGRANIKTLIAKNNFVVVLLGFVIQLGEKPAPESAMKPASDCMASSGASRILRFSGFRSSLTRPTTPGVFASRFSSLKSVAAAPFTIRAVDAPPRGRQDCTAVTQERGGCTRWRISL